MNSDLIEQSLEAVAERVGDPTALVYQHLFAMAPELQALFVRDVDGSVRGEMLQKGFETVLDLVGDCHYAEGLIATEWVNHQNVGVPPEQFGLFFAAMIAAFREALGPGWTPEFDAAWQSVLDRIADVTARVAANA